MKTLRLGLLLLLTSLSFLYASAQHPSMSKKYDNNEIEKMVQAFKMEYSQNVVPTELLVQKFRKDFPNAYDIEWEKAASLYEIEFEIRGSDYQAYYDEQGHLVMLIYDIYQSDLPDLIKKQITSKYPNYRFDDIERIIKGTDVSYNVEMERGDVDVRIIIKSDGTIISQMEDY
ncbi:MAG: PepSY-like domain-containing protein [Tannerella sp.]|jgi:hypothetical protein|nr:PepSY-like domain-containing protein [Tannerella sp.]